MTTLSLLVAGLATWRLSHALVKESGPLMIFSRMRARLGRTQKRSGGLFDLISCVYCTSVWIALFVALYDARNLVFWLGHAFAIAAIAYFLELAADKFNAFTVITRPASDAKIDVGASPTSEKRNDMVGYPHGFNRKPAIVTSSLLNK